MTRREYISGEGMYIHPTLEEPGEWEWVHCRRCQRRLDVDQVDDNGACEDCADDAEVGDDE